jgi:hypothetical protein
MNPMQRKFHPMSIEDREMFAYNAEYQKRQLEIARVLSHPEQRIKYCFSLIEGADEQTRAKCYNKIAEYSAQLDYSAGPLLMTMPTYNAMQFHSKS